MPKPSSRNHGHAFFVVVYAIRPRIASTSRPAASATHLKMLSVIRPGGRGPVPIPRAAGGGEPFGRGGAVTAMSRSGIYASGGTTGGGTGRVGGTRPVPSPPEITTRGRGWS